MRKLFAAVAAVVLFGVTAALADPVGNYDIKGTDPGKGGAYSGTVSVERTGQTYKVVWVIGGQRYIGTGIGNKDFLAVSYISGNQTGLALYAPEGDGWTGVWTYAGGTTMGTDRWTRIKGQEK
jgi:hypothetical protein